MNFSSSICGTDFLGVVGQEMAPVIGFKYLEIWFETLKLSREYGLMCKTGLIDNPLTFKTYKLFGQIDNLSFEDWWRLRGAKILGSGQIAISEDCFLGYECDPIDKCLGFGVLGAEHLPTAVVKSACELAKQKCPCLLSDAPVAWPFYSCRITPGSMSVCLTVLQAIQNNQGKDRKKLWQLGQELNLKPTAMPTKGDLKIEVSDKRIAMTKLVNALNTKGTSLVKNAQIGQFPSFQ